MTMEWADGLGWSGRQNDRLDEPYKTRQKSRESVQGVRRYCCHIIYISHSNYTNPCSNPQQLQHKDDSPGCKAGRLKKEERSSVMFLSSGGQQVLQFACAHQRNSCVDAVSSGVLSPIKPGKPVPRVRVFWGYKLGNPYPYPKSTHDIYPRVSLTRDIP